MKIFNAKVFEKFNLNIDKGSFISIIGPISGGKTKLLIEIFNKTDKKFKISYVNEKNNFFGSLKEILYTLLLAHNVPNNEIKARVKRVLKQLDIYDLLYQPFEQLSIMDKKRFMLAQGLITNPDLLIIDNLFAQFNTKEATKIIDYLKSLCHKGMTVIFTTYNSNYCLYTDKTIVVSNSNIIFFDIPKSVFENEKVLIKLGITIPFMIDLSSKLKSYELVTKTILDMERMVKYIWK